MVFSNIGFESASGYGEESKHPHRYIPLAMFAVLVTTAILYIWTGYSQVIGVGASNAASVLGNLAQTPGPFYALADSHVGYWFEVAVGILLTTSTWASCLAFHNVAARYLYGMAREDQVPFFSRAFGRTQPRTGSPWVASILQTGICLICVGFLAFVVQKTLTDGSVVYSLGIAGGLTRPPAESAPTAGSPPSGR